MRSENELRTTVGIAEEAANLVLEYFGSAEAEAQAKGDRDVVTAADLASEKLIRRRLAERFPSDGVVGEEGDTTQAERARRWYVDPLDGTLNYSRGLPIWCVSIALFEYGRPVLGVIVDPIRRETFSAARGLGVWLNGERVTTSSTRELQSAFMHMTVDFNETSMLEGLNDMQVLAPRVLRTRNIGSAALALAYVACGRFDVMLHRFANAWDYGAGVALIQEAGGVVTGTDGEPYSDSTRSLLATNGLALHDALLPLVKASADS